MYSNRVQAFVTFSSFNKLLLQKEELEQKQLHLLQVVESERTSRWQYAQQCEELSNEVKKLRSEVTIYIYQIKTKHFESNIQDVLCESSG